MRVQVAGFKDLPAIYDIELKCYEFPLGHSDLSEMLETPASIPCVVKLNTRIVAWGYAVYVEEERALEVERLATLPDFRRQGYATRILALMWREANRYNPDKITICVPEYQMDVHDPDSVSDFLWKSGFKATGLKKREFYCYGRWYDGIIMSRSF